ncbi:MAG: hypothetical protein HRU17_19435 [Polyangiaceae bacterium]|nr:hypothetical protein [Polyangiaceae bacterium]
MRAPTALFILSVSVSVSVSASAGANTADKLSVKALLESGVSQMEAGKFDAACPELEES